MLQYRKIVTLMKYIPKDGTVYITGVFLAENRAKFRNRSGSVIYKIYFFLPEKEMVCYRDHEGGYLFFPELRESYY